jgi:hypothetical protein
MYPIMVVVKTIQLAMVGIVAEETAEEENVVKVEMIKTLSLLTIPLAYVAWSTTVVVLSQSYGCVLTVTGTRLS